jgi:hypothetical protein
MTKDEFLRLATTAIADALVSDRATSGPDMTMADVGVAAMAFQDFLAQQPRGTFPMPRRRYVMEGNQYGVHAEADADFIAAAPRLVRQLLACLAELDLNVEAMRGNLHSRIAEIVKQNVHVELDFTLSCRVCENDVEGHLHAPECPILKLSEILWAEPESADAVDPVDGIVEG